ncbi:T9SS C-terminal target domain-containing protein [Flavobacterium pallidum]|nr:T9SS C-terminal target domain-containing protein [Flavobacterium pallidum]
MAYAQPAEVLCKPKLKRSCIKPSKAILLQNELNEGSGLVAWEGKFWAHNDSGNARLFALDTASGNIIQTYDLPLENRDWEDLGQDKTYFYLGNFGNNAHRVDTLQIYRIRKESLLQKIPSIDTISFAWPETITGNKKDKINFDCEAMAIVGDSICLFTKEWKRGHRTRLFTLPKVPGKWTANYRYTLKTRILVTGASYEENTKQLVLSGYNMVLRPFLLVFPETNGTDFFSKPGRKIKIRRRFRQMEGVTTFDGVNYFVINEGFQLFFIHTSPRIYKVSVGNRSKQ